jgi:drug/metabolite transporter (DMT)-like permease
MQKPVAPRKPDLNVNVIAAFAAIYLLWGGTYLAIALDLQSLPPLLLMGSRAVVAGLTLLALAFATHSAWPTRAEWRHAAVGGMLLFAGCHGALGYAQRVIPSGLSAVMLATIPFWMVLLGMVFPVKDKPARGQLAALVPGFAGVALIAWPGETQHVSAGMLLVLLGAALAWATGSMYAQNYSAEVQPLSLAGMQMLSGGTALMLLSTGISELTTFSPHDVSLSAILSFAYLAFAGGAVAFTCYVWLLERMSAPMVATYTFVNPMIAVMLGWAVLGERITAKTLFGAALVIGSLIVLVWLADRKTQTKRRLSQCVPSASRGDESQ